MSKKVISLQFKSRTGLFCGSDYTYFIDHIPRIERDVYKKSKFEYPDVYFEEIVKSNGKSYSKGHKTRIVNIWNSFEEFKADTNSSLEEKDLFTISKYKMTFGSPTNLEFKCDGEKITGSIYLNNDKIETLGDIKDEEFILSWLDRKGYDWNTELHEVRKVKVFNNADFLPVNSNLDSNSAYCHFMPLKNLEPIVTKIETPASITTWTSNCGKTSSITTNVTDGTNSISDMMSNSLIIDNRNLNKDLGLDVSISESEIDISSKTSNEYKERNKFMDFSKMFNITFGKIFSSDVRASLYGIAVKGGDGRFRAFDKNSDKIMDVTGMVFDSDMLFTIPIAVSSIKKGDVILNAGNYVTVTAIHSDGTLTVIDPKASEQKIAIPAKNMFGFDFVSKVYCPFEGIFNAPSNDNPFGVNPMMFMLLGDDMDNSTKMMMVMSMMGSNADSSMLLPLLMMNGKDNNSNSDMLMAMCMMNMQKSTDKSRQNYEDEIIRDIYNRLASKESSSSGIEKAPEAIKVTM